MFYCISSLWKPVELTTLSSLINLCHKKTSSVKFSNYVWPYKKLAACDQVLNIVQQVDDKRLVLKTETEDNM